MKRKDFYLMLFIFFPIIIFALIIGFRLFESIIVASIITLIATPVKIFGDKIFQKFEKKWFSKTK